MAFDYAAIQGSAKEWSLDCVNPVSQLPLAVRGDFTQPRARFLADPCKSVAKYG